jgi:hypothetical protein
MAFVAATTETPVLVSGRFMIDIQLERHYGKALRSTTTPSISSDDPRHRGDDV